MGDQGVMAATHSRMGHSVRMGLAVTHFPMGDSGARAVNYSLMGESVPMDHSEMAVGWGSRIFR